MPTDKPLTIDADRHRAMVDGRLPSTDIFVRATHAGKWDQYDIAALDSRSLLRWLRGRGGVNEWAEDCVGMLLGHGHIATGDQQGR